MGAPHLYHAGPNQGKAKAFDKLAAFYDACAQVEIDEYRDYDKAEQRAELMEGFNLPKLSGFLPWSNGMINQICYLVKKKRNLVGCIDIPSSC